MPAKEAQIERTDDVRFRLAMHGAGTGMAIASLDGILQDVNPSLCRMLGYAGEDLVGHHLSELAHVDDRGRDDALISDLLQGRQDCVELEKRCRHHDGRVLWGNLNLGVMRDASDQPCNLILLVRDISEQRARNEVLEQRVQAQAAELQALNAQMELFAAGVSHDLRAPLRAIDGFAWQLEKHHAAQLDSDGCAYLERIRGAAGAMAGLMDGLLELSRVSRGEVRQDPVDLSLLAEWTGAELQEAEPGRAAVIQVQPGLATSGDERMLKVLLSQLMGNAWKFSPTDAPVRIEVGGRDDAAGLQLWVRDWGRGFEMAYADKVFEPFKRVHGAVQGGGHGLGLAIARRIVERHGGSIGAESVPGIGTTIRVILPSRAAAA